MKFEMWAYTYEEGGKTVAWKRGLDFVEAIEEAGSYGMTEESIGRFAALIHMCCFKEGFLWEDCNIECCDADPFTVYIGVEL